MSTQTRKQREIREREARILQSASEMLVTGGYHGLNMDAIAEKLQYSKGTIYNHYSCKEEIIIALAIQSSESRISLFERAAAFRGSSRERICAIGFAAEIFSRLYPSHFKVEQLIRSASIWEKTSEERRLVMRGCESRCVGMVAGVVRDGVAQGDLELPVGMSPEDLVFGLWSMSFGASWIIATSDSLPLLGIADPYVALRQGINRMLDGYGWLPLSTQLDYHQVSQRIGKEVFADECQRLQGG